MKPVGLVVLPVLIPVLAFPAAIAGGAPAAVEASAATCAVDSGVVLDPGISMKPGRGTFESRAGKVACVGVVNNRPVAGLGKLRFEGTYGRGDNCEHGKGKGIAVAVVPKATGGTMKVGGSFRFTRVGTAVAITGTLGGASLVGNLQFVPKVGQDCVNRRVTRATVHGAAALGYVSPYL